MNYEKMWKELKKTINLIKTSKMNGIITGAMQYLEIKIKELEKGENDDQKIRTSTKNQKTTNRIDNNQNAT